MIWIVALTGGIGSGKSTISQAFANLGVPIIDADIIAREVVAPKTSALNSIVERYGRSILLSDGSLNRTTLRQYIFTDINERNWVDQLLHPLIQQKTQHQIATLTQLYVLWVVPLLIENGLHLQANRVLVADVDPEIQIARTMSRDGITRQQVEHILASQISRQQRLACADDIIDNNGTATTVAPLVASLHRKYLSLATQAQQDLYK